MLNCVYKQQLNQISSRVWDCTETLPLYVPSFISFSNNIRTLHKLNFYLSQILTYLSTNNYWGWGLTYHTSPYTRKTPLSYACVTEALWMRHVWSRARWSWAVDAPDLIQRWHSDAVASEGQVQRQDGNWGGMQRHSMNIWLRWCNRRSKGDYIKQVDTISSKGLIEKHVLQFTPPISPSLSAIEIFKKRKHSASGWSSEDGEGGVAIYVWSGPEGLRVNGQATL